MLHLSPDEFWRATPNELSAAAEALIEARGGSGSSSARRLGADDIAELRAMLVSAA